MYLQLPLCATDKRSRENQLDAFVAEVEGVNDVRLAQSVAALKRGKDIRVDAFFATDE